MLDDNAQALLCCYAPPRIANASGGNKAQCVVREKKQWAAKPRNESPQEKVGGALVGIEDDITCECPS
jgi:hypothetical protein